MFSRCLQKCFKNTQINIGCSEKLIAVDDERDVEGIIENFYSSKTNHTGLDETEQRIKSNYYWPNIRQPIQNFINNCDICHIKKYDRKPLKLELKVITTKVKPF